MNETCPPALLNNLALSYMDKGMYQQSLALLNQALAQVKAEMAKNRASSSNDVMVGSHGEMRVTGENDQALSAQALVERNIMRVQALMQNADA